MISTVNIQWCDSFTNVSLLQ